MKHRVIHLPTISTTESENWYHVKTFFDNFKSNLFGRINFFLFWNTYNNIKNYFFILSQRVRYLYQLDLPIFNLPKLLQTSLDPSIPLINIGSKKRIFKEHERRSQRIRWRWAWSIIDWTKKKDIDDNDRDVVLVNDNVICDDDVIYQDGDFAYNHGGNNAFHEDCDAGNGAIDENGDWGKGVDFIQVYAWR